MIVIAVVAVVAAATGLAATFGRKRLRERREVEGMFASEGDDRVWWEERR